MKKLYMRKLGLLVLLMVGLGFSQIKALTTYTSYSVGNNEIITLDDEVEVSGSLSVGNNGSLTVNGDLTVGGKITVSSGAYLIVYGNLISTTTQDIQIDGNIVVVGDLNIADGANIKNNGNLIVGGDFLQAGGDIATKGNDGLKIYILNPDAIVDVPEGSYVEDVGNIGDLEDFRNFEASDPILNDIVETVIVDLVIGYQWKTDVNNSSWLNSLNWTGDRIPGATSNVRIRPSITNPEIVAGDGIIEVNNLTIDSGGVLTLRPGARLTVNGTLTIEEEGGLVMENTAEVDGLASLLTHGDIVGEARISLEFPRDEWYYVSQPIKNANPISMESGTKTAVSIPTKVG